MRTFIPRIVGWSVAHAWRTLFAALVLVAIALAIAVTRFDITTDTAELISPNVPWRQQERATEAAFPQLADTMLIVVDGATPDLAESAAAQLASALSEDHAHFRRVTRPDGGEFFAKEGLLFASQAQVSRATADLIQAQPLLGPLAADPALRGVAGSLSTMLDGVARGEARLDQLRPAMRSLTRAIDLSLSGKPAYFSWQRLFAGNNPALAPPSRRLVLTQPLLDHSDLEAGSAARAQLWQAVRAMGLTETHGVRVRVTGEVPLADEEFATLKENIGLVGLVMLIAMVTTLWLATRSAKLLAAILATTIAGLIVTTAVGLLAVGRLNLISIAFIPLFVGLGVDFGIQLSVRFNAERREGAALADAMTRAATALGPSLLLAASAVFLGFAAFLPTDYVGISELGIIAALGMAIALALSVTLLPALVMLFAPPPPAKPMAFPRLASADRALATRRRTVLIAFGVSLAISIALLPWVKFDFNPLHLRDPEAPAMATLADLTRDPDRTPNTIDVLAPDHAAAVSLAKRLSALPEVRQVVSIDSFVPEDQAAKLAMIGDASTLLDLTINPFDVAPAPSDAEQVAALSFVSQKLQAVSQAGQPGAGDARALAHTIERLANATPEQRQKVDAMLTKPLAVMLNQIRASLQAAPISRATLPPALVRDWVAPDGRERLQVFPAGNANDNRTIHRFRDAVARVTPAISGLPVATQAAAATVARAFVQAGVIAFLLVSILLFVVLRDVREVAFTLAPVILSIFLTLGTCVVIAQPLNFANIIAFPLLFGVGVAFHIYFVMAWRGGTRDLLQSSLARAVLFSALATGTAFGSLWLSAHPGTASMGKILMISLIWTLICALIFEPALLGPPRPDRRAGPAVPLH